jgi:hypothetical protein
VCGSEFQVRLKPDTTRLSQYFPYSTILFNGYSTIP